MLSSGARVPLILDPAVKLRGTVRGVGGIGIYPGAIVALKGKNGGGGYFLATEVLGVSNDFRVLVLLLSYINLLRSHPSNPLHQLRVLSTRR